VGITNSKDRVKVERRCPPLYHVLEEARKDTIGECWDKMSYAYWKVSLDGKELWTELEKEYDR